MISKQQIIRIRTIISKLTGFDDEVKQNTVLAFTGGRTGSIRELQEQEANQLISSLQKQIPWNPSADPRIKMQRKIIAMAHEIGWNLKSGKIDMDKLNSWCKKSGYLRKEFNKYSYGELPKLVSQFETVYHFYIKKLN